MFAGAPLACKKLRPRPAVARRAVLSVVRQPFRTDIAPRGLGTPSAMGDIRPRQRVRLSGGSSGMFVIGWNVRGARRGRRGARRRCAGSVALTAYAVETALVLVPLAGGHARGTAGSRVKLCRGRVRRRSAGGPGDWSCPAQCATSGGRARATHCAAIAGPHEQGVAADEAGASDGASPLNSVLAGRRTYWARVAARHWG